MNAEFFYRNLLMSMGFHYSGPPWVFLTVVIALALAIFGVTVVKRSSRTLTQRRLLEALLDFFRSFGKVLKRL